MSQRRKTGNRKTASKASSQNRAAKLTHPVLALLFFFVFSIFGLRYVEKFFDGSPPQQTAPAVADKSSLADKSAVVDKPIEKRIRRPRVVLIIDDLGQSREQVDRLLRIEQPLNLAVLPYLPYSEYAARAAYREGNDVILHLPMEPKYSTGYTADDAGEGVLLLGFPIKRIRDEVRKNIEAVPKIVGVNNHMGSKFMENKEPVETVIKELKAQGLYFIDSLTTPKSYGYSVAKRLGVKTLKRDIFIDRSKNHSKEYTVGQLDRLVRIAEKNGIAVGIGHPYPQTIDALMEYMPRVAKKVEFMKISAASLD